MRAVHMALSEGVPAFVVVHTDRTVAVMNPEAVARLLNNADSAAAVAQIHYMEGDSTTLVTDVTVDSSNPAELVVSSFDLTGFFAVVPVAPER